MPRQSAKKSKRGHTLPAVNLTFEELDQLTYIQLREYARNQGMIRLNPGKQDLLRRVCSFKKIPHPADGPPVLIRTPSPSPTPLSVRMRRRAANGPISVQQPSIGAATAPTVGAVPKYPAGRANRLDTRRFSPLPEKEEDIAADYLDPEGFNRPAPESTPEPAERLCPAPPADAESLEQTVQMLQAFRKRNDELAKQVKEMASTAQALKKTAADLMQSVVIQKTARVRMEQYLSHYRQEQPIFAHKVVFPPDDPVFVSIDEEHEKITDELDAMDEDREPDFAIYKAAKMLQRAQKGKIPAPDAYDEDEDTVESVTQFVPHRTFYQTETSQGPGESEKDDEDPEALHQPSALYPDMRPKGIKRTASVRDLSDTETGESSLRKTSRKKARSTTDVEISSGFPVPQMEPLHPGFGVYQMVRSAFNRYALHERERLWKGIKYTPEGPQPRSPTPTPTEPGTPPATREANPTGTEPATASTVCEERPLQQAPMGFHPAHVFRESSFSVPVGQEESETWSLPPALPAAQPAHTTHYSPARDPRLRARAPAEQLVPPRSPPSDLRTTLFLDPNSVLRPRPSSSPIFIEPGAGI